MSVIASSLINWSALWKIVLAALVGGTGVVLAFGFALLALNRAQSARNEGVKLADWGIAGLCGMFCVSVVVIGIYAMAHKPKSKPAKPSKSAALIVPAATGAKPKASAS
jgi:hypothetical protein